MSLLLHLSLWEEAGVRLAGGAARGAGARLFPHPHLTLLRVRKAGYREWRQHRPCRRIWRCDARALRGLSRAGRRALRAGLPVLSFPGKRVHAGPRGAYAIVDGVCSCANNMRGLKRVLKKQVKICAWMLKTARGSRVGSPNFPLTCKAHGAEIQMGSGAALKFYCLPYLLSSPILSVTAFKGTCDTRLQRYKSRPSLPLSSPAGGCTVNAEQRRSLSSCLVWCEEGFKWFVKSGMGFGGVLNPGCSAVPPSLGSGGEGGCGIVGISAAWHRRAASPQPWAITEGPWLPPLGVPWPLHPPSQPLGIRSLLSLDVTLPPFPWFHHEKKGPFPSPIQHSSARLRWFTGSAWSGAVSQGRASVCGRLLPFSIINPGRNWMFPGWGQRQTSRRISLPICPWDLISNLLSPPPSNTGSQRYRLQRVWYPFQLFFFPLTSSRWFEPILFPR